MVRLVERRRQGCQNLRCTDIRRRGGRTGYLLPPPPLPPAFPPPAPFAPLPFVLRSARSDVSIAWKRDAAGRRRRSTRDVIKQIRSKEVAAARGGGVREASRAARHPIQNHHLLRALGPLCLRGRPARMRFCLSAQRLSSCALCARASAHPLHRRLRPSRPRAASSSARSAPHAAAGRLVSDGPYPLEDDPGGPLQVRQLPLRLQMDTDTDTPGGALSPSTLLRSRAGVR